ncbi:hypothetical protein DL98DRAFT_582324 [Cadophora sp. DSE1049]|nr:hypothetical protein DL98DRAFT_582324 [Cadophora sp. DSE1049]
MGEPTEDSPISSLSEFAVLKKVTASANILLGRPRYARLQNCELSGEYAYNEKYINNFPSILPSSLKNLTMTLCGMSAAEAIEKLFEKLPPNLRSIKLEFKCELDISSLREGSLWPKLQGLAVDIGVELIVSVAEIAKRGYAVCALLTPAEA